MATYDDSIDIAVDGERIAGTIVTPDTRMPGVLFVHGWGGSQEQYLARAREVAALGCVCLTFDLRGHAQTRPQQETVTRENNLHDVLAAYDVLARHREVDASAIAVVGSSYGGYLAAILTTLRPVKWLALRVPALYMDNGWELPKRQLHKEQDLESYRRNLVPAETNRALRACAAFKGDVLLIESENDDTVPHEAICSYRDACVQAHSLTYRVIEGADHGLSEQRWQRSYTALLMGWMTEMVLGARQGSEPTQAATMPGSAVPEAPPQAG
ncbi:MAG TPA: alpha/beta fold hydrolase [Noviherbaspirillum sp.]|uniref:alpha/beta hydrolase family protein n=1 Tax=Noviherbaspirillum sp. TaxID=1926288 RepID=UPI002D412AB8|nr:alpha/beta fold hydrolase [Noviherbaspirillum sp.]HYD95551.1 alpha/beta fold hydrolase [Noviherbaspirillum sp.]